MARSPALALGRQQRLRSIGLVMIVLVSLPMLGAPCDVAERQISQAPESPPRAPPVSVVPNASRVQASVLEHSVWSPEALADAVPPVPPGETLYSVRVAITGTVPVSAEFDSLAVPGRAYTAFSSTVLDADLVGRDIEATLELSGDTHGVRWWITHVQVGQ